MILLKKLKSTDVIMLLKYEKGVAFPQNYRLISLLLSISKIAGGINAGRIPHRIKKNNMLP